MIDIINKIIKQNKELFETNPNIKKINIGFTNTIYNIDNKYIIKICTNKNNEDNFKKEIEFYKTNQDNELIPKLYYSDTNKKDIPYYYEIIEKLEGISLYNVWHTFSEEQRENVIKQLCEGMKLFHNNKGIPYDWIKYITDKFINLYSKAKELNLFTKEEQKIIDNASQKFKLYLDSYDFVLIHNDLHFDNIFINNNKIKLIDFERSMYAPRDFELDILYRMIRKPWKYASEETEKYTDQNDYQNIMKYIEKYYPKLINIQNLNKRLAIYDLIYFLKHLVNHPEVEELKNDVINAVKEII